MKTGKAGVDREKEIDKIFGLAKQQKLEEGFDGYDDEEVI